MTQYGIDIASYQGVSTDWTAVAGNNITFVSVKLTEGNDYTNPYAASQVDGARSVGIAAGGYHFARPGDVSAQVTHFADQLAARGLLGPGSLWPMLDMEDPAIGDPDAFVSAFADLLRARTGVAGLLVYANLDWYTHVLSPDRWASDTVRLWVAQFNGDPGNPDFAHAQLVLHQHSSQGTVPGIGGYVDRDATLPGVDLSAVLIGNTPAPAPAPQPAPTPDPAPSGWVDYRIVWGDTLSAIAARTGTTVDEIARRNGISDPNRIGEGQVIQVPGTGDTGQSYQIAPGDTLSDLAARWGTTVDAICARNGIGNPDYIQAGAWITRP